MSMMKMKELVKLQLKYFYDYIESKKPDEKLLDDFAARLFERFNMIVSWFDTVLFVSIRSYMSRILRCITYYDALILGKVIGDRWVKRMKQLILQSITYAQTNLGKRSMYELVKKQRRDFHDRFYGEECCPECGSHLLLIHDLKVRDHVVYSCELCGTDYVLVNKWLKKKLLVKK
jgi:uncharacterized protein with PIN domain